jgi:hypothetical protein
VAVLVNALWDWVHDLESEVAFALALCYYSTEQLYRMSIAWNRCRASTTPSNISLTG